MICSLGSKGAVLVDDNGRWQGTGPRVPVLSTVGAGDSLLSGFLRVGIAWATAAVQTPGADVPSAGLVDPRVVELSAIALPVSGGASIRR